MHDPLSRVRVLRNLLPWALLYLLVSLTPLFVILLDSPPERDFWTEFGVALGFVALAMMALQAVLTARQNTVSRSLGQDTLLQFHRQAGLVAFGLVLVHPIVLIAADGDNWAYLDPRAGVPRALALWFVLGAFPLLIALSLWHSRMRLPYQWWRLSHGALAVLLVLVGLVHTTRVNYYVASPWKRGLWIAIVVASVAAVVYVRVITPWRMRSRPYRVSEVTEVARGTWSLRVEPEHGEAVEFLPGQFGFLTIARSPFDLEQHPFSFASAATDRDHLEFAVKELGDYTDRIGATEIGATAFVDGPYGGMVLDEESGGLFAVAGGIGITPVLSMVRTLAARTDRRPVVLVYANERREAAAFADELDRLADELGDDLRVVHVLADPPSDGWEGRRGMVTPALLAELLPAEHAQRWQYVACGPPGMMEVVERSLLELGIPLDRIESERFDIGASLATGRRHVSVRRLVITLGVVMLVASALFAA